MKKNLRVGVACCLSFSVNSLLNFALKGLKIDDITVSIGIH